MKVLEIVWARRAAALVLTGAVVGGIPHLASGQVAADVINPGTTAWFEAAETGRADTLVLGDSLVWHSGNGWSQGFSDALQNTVGLAGSGLQQGIGGEGQQFGIGPEFASALGTNNGGALPTGYEQYAWRDVWAASGTTPQGTLLGSITAAAPRTAAGYDWTLYTAAGPGGGSLTALSRYGQAPYTTLQTIGTTAITNPTSGLGKTVLHFDSAPDPTLAQELQVNDLTNAAVLYSRITVPGATGATVTTWGYGGEGTEDFLNDQYLGGGTSAAGRQTVLNSIVDGGSGKLNVVIAEGFNDRNETTQISADGVDTSNTAAGFAANMRALIASIRGDWVAGGNLSSNLSFTLVGMYQDQFSISDPTYIQSYATAEASIAAGDSQISFVNLFDKAPDYDQAVADGYMYQEGTDAEGNPIYDPVHFSSLGANVYSQDIIDALVPEPSSLCLLGFATMGLLARRRRIRGEPA